MYQAELVSRSTTINAGSISEHTYEATKPITANGTFASRTAEER
jgi:hypothetical protein